MVRLLAIDLSGVLTIEADVSPFDFLGSKGLSKNNALRIMTQLFDGQQLWDRVEKGELSMDDFSNQVALWINNLGGGCLPSEAMYFWGNPDPFLGGLGVRKELLNILPKLARKYDLALCTNNVREWRTSWQSLIPINAFKYIFDSSEMGVRKPELEYFDKVEKVSACSGSDILFIDDRCENVVAAENFKSWQTVHFTSTEALLEKIRRIR